MRPVVTFDLFSALLDSRAGAAAGLDRIGGRRGWPVRGAEVYDVWDPLHKAAQRECRSWVPYRELARPSLAAAYERLGLAGDPAGDLEELLAALPDWPLWPDVAAGLPRLARDHRIGLLSNVDDDLARATRAAPLVEDDLLLTSQRLRCYKPDPRIYTGAVREVAALAPAGGAGPPVVHVAASARDVRGALEAGIPVVRLRRPGHAVDPDGPTPRHEAGSVDELVAVLPAVLAEADADPGRTADGPGARGPGARGPGAR